MTRDRGAVRTLAIAILLLAGAGLPGRAQQSPAPPSPSSHVAGGSSAERLSRWLLAVGRHDPGTMDEYAKTLLAWRWGDLNAVVLDFDDLRAAVRRRGDSARVPGCKCTLKEFLQPLGVTASQIAGDEIRKRAAILHADVAILANTVAARPDSSINVFPAGPHIGTAMQFVNALRHDAPGEPFAHQWFVSIAARLAWQHEIRSLPAFVDDLALSLFPSNRELLMISGCVHEVLASPPIQEGLDISPPIPGNSTTHLRQAEQAFRRAIGRGTPPPELSMRLGHVLGMLGRHDEALSFLKPARDGSSDVTILYFTNLFIGDEEAALGHDDLAREAYLRAQAIFPSAPSAYLALSRLAYRADDKPRAAAVIGTMLSRESERVHPWVEYYGAGRQAMAEQMLSDLCAPFKKAKSQ